MSAPMQVRPPGIIGARASKVVGGRAKPGHNERDDSPHNTLYPDVYGAKPGHDEWKNASYYMRYPNAYGAMSGYHGLRDIQP
jgi:hypothetical protein